jgi:O-antigen ligase
MYQIATLSGKRRASKLPYYQVVAAAFVMVMFSNLSLYAFKSWAFPLPPSGWLVTFVICIAPLAFARKLSDTVHIHPLWAWSAFYLLISAAWVFVAQDWALGIEDLLNNVNFVLTVGISLVVFSLRGCHAAAAKAIFVSTCMGVALNIYEFFTPGAFSKTLGRSAGLFGNPNFSGSVLVLGLILAYPLVPIKFRTLFQLFVGAGVLLTLSRGSIACWGVVVILQHLMERNTRASTGSLFVGFGFLIILLQSPLWKSVQNQIWEIGRVNPALTGRLEFLGGDERTLEDSRVKLASEAWNMFLDRPLLGHGSGSATIDMGPHLILGTHNEYLTLLMQYGIMGGILFISLLAVLFYGVPREHRRLAGILVVFLCVDAFFTHNMLKQAPYAIAIGFMASLPARSSQRFSLTTNPRMN